MVALPIMMTGNYTPENMIIKLLPFSTFNYCHRYTRVKRKFFLHKYLLFHYHCSFSDIRPIGSRVYSL